MRRKLKSLTKGFLLVVVGLSTTIAILTRCSFDPYNSEGQESLYSVGYYIEEPSPTNLPSFDESVTTAPEKIAKKENKLHKLHWTSVHGSNEAEAYHFISAYLDDRERTQGRPAIVVVGYFSRTARPTKLYCLFKYSSGKTRCLDRGATQTQANCDSVVDKRKSKPMLYICHLAKSPSVIIPVSVRISNVSDCKSASGEIPVDNIDHVRKRSPPKMKKFGVFIGGPLIQKDNVIQNLTHFIQMSQLLGAEFFTMYISPEQMDNSVIQFLLDTYPDLVRVIEWKKFEIHYPLHYYGQLVLISDCLYRSMYEVQYLVMMDLDEMILPVRHNDWTELTNELEKKGRYASFSFLNRFIVSTPSQYTTTTSYNDNITSYDEVEATPSDPYSPVDPKVVQHFNGSNIPAYFTRTQEVQCFFGYGAKTKLIINPRLLVRGTVHEACESVKSYQKVYNVPPEEGINGHYREHSIPECTSKPTLTNTAAIKFAKRYAERFHHRT